MFAVGSVVVAFLLGSPIPARAQEVDSFGVPGVHEWGFYGGPEISVYAHSGKGNMTTTDLTGPRYAFPDNVIGDLPGVAVFPARRSREYSASFLAGGTLGATTPALDVPFRPRLYMDLNVSDPKTTETQLARLGVLGDIRFPTIPNQGGLNKPVGEGNIVGTGTRITVQQQKPHVHAGLGASLEFPIPGDQLIRVKTGLVYSRTQLDIRGQVRRAVRLNNDKADAQSIDDFRLILLDDRVKKVYHAIGPSVEVEYFPGQAASFGPLTFSLFARGHASYTLNSVRTDMQQCNTAGGQPNECASWRYDQDHWAFRVGMGVRLTWLPGRPW